MRDVPQLVAIIDQAYDHTSWRGSQIQRLKKLYSR